MFAPKILKAFVGGAVLLFALGVALQGLTRLESAVDEINFLGSELRDLGVETIDQLAEIIIIQHCPVCQGQSILPPLGTMVGNWYGMTKAALHTDLAANFPGWELASFSSKQVIVRAPPQRCESCAGKWPPRGYLGLYLQDRMAVYAADGTLVEIVGPAPGAWLEQLSETIPFESPEECEQLIINLTS